jgi:hypothetical protein
MKVIALLISSVLCVIIKSGFAQEAKPDSSLRKNKPVYFFLIQSGALLNKQAALTTSTIHGIKIGNRLRAGLGIGYDSFKDWQTMPVFGSASWDFYIINGNSLFAQLNYGWTPYVRNYAIKDYYGFKKVRGGEYFSAMIGYRINSGNLSVALQAGFRHQKVEADYENIYYAWLSSYPSPYNMQNLRQAMNRLAISLSIGFR